MNRERDRERLRVAIRTNALVVLHGLPGIGKRTLLDIVLHEERPRAPRSEINCIPDMGARRFAAELSEAVGYELAGLRELPAAAKARLHDLVIVYEAQHICATSEDAVLLRAWVDALAGTNVLVVLVATRQIKGLDVPAVRLWGLSADDVRRVFEFWCKTLGIEADFDLVPHLHGHPLAAKLAARLLVDGDQRGLDRMMFLRELRTELLEVLLSGVELGGDEQRTLEALSVFRRPVDERVLNELPLELGRSPEMTRGCSSEMTQGG